MARLVVAAAVHWHMPFHHERIIGRRHQPHAAVRQMRGQPLPLCRAKRVVVQSSRRSARSRSPIEAQHVDNLLLFGIHHRHLSIRGHAGIYVARTFEPQFSEAMPLTTLLLVARSMLLGYLSRCVLCEDWSRAES
jgi:hypothetical protein